MRITGKLVRNTFLVIFLIVVMGIFSLYPMLKGAAGYAAKMMCSSCFVEGLTPDQIEKMELSAFPFNKIVNEVDSDKRQVTSTILGLVSMTATYKDGAGATLYPDGITNHKPTYQLPDPVEAWPEDTAVLKAIKEKINIANVQKYVDREFNNLSRAVLIVKDGQIIAEKYANGINMESPLLGWSMAKTLTNLLVGIQVQKGKVDIDQPVPVDEWQNDERRYITWNNLLQMSSGLDWNEDYSKTSLSDVSRMLYVRSDMYKYAISAESKTVPGSEYYYSSGTTNILCGLLKSLFEDQTDYHQFPTRELFNKLGMNHSIIETDAVGTFVGSSYGYCSARDWARIGLLFLNNGKWNGEQIVPEWWVDYSITPAKNSEGTYGAQLWLNQSKKYLPDLSSDIYFADGYRGQRVFILPSENMVVVTLNSSAEDIDFNNYLKGLLQTIN